MSDIGRRRSSKWDLPEGNKSPEDRPDSARSSRMRSSFHDREAPRRHLPNDADDINVHSRRTSSGRKDFHMDETINDKPSTWDRGGKYGARMSPGRDEWRQRKGSRSPKNRISSYRSSRSRSRSRSRSPGSNHRHEPLPFERSRNRAIPPPLRRDFADGGSKRANDGTFSHNANRSYDRRNSENSVGHDFESKNKYTGPSRYSSDGPRENSVSSRSRQNCNDFLKGRCSRGASCRYAHHEDTLDGKGSIDDRVKDGDNDGRRMGAQMGSRRDLNLEGVNQAWKGTTWDDPISGVSQANGWPEDKTGVSDATTSDGKGCTDDVVRHGEDDRRRRGTEPGWRRDKKSDSANPAWKGTTWDDPMSGASQAKGWPEDKMGIFDATTSDGKGSVDDRVKDGDNDRRRSGTQPGWRRDHKPDKGDQAWKGTTWDDPMSGVSQAKGWPEDKMGVPDAPTSDGKGSMDDRVKDGDNDRRRRGTQPGWRRDKSDSANQAWKGTTWDAPMSGVSQANGWPENKMEVLDATTSDGKGSLENIVKGGDNGGRRRDSQPSWRRDHDLDGANQALKSATWDDPLGVSQAKGWPEDKAEVFDATMPRETAWTSREDPWVSHNNLQSTGEALQGATWDDNGGRASQAEGWPKGKSENLDTIKPTQRTEVPANNLDGVSEVRQGATWADAMSNASQAEGWPDGKCENWDSTNPTQRPLVETGTLDLDAVSKGHTLGAGAPTAGELVSNEEKLPHQWKLQNTFNYMGVSVSNGPENCFPDVGTLAFGTVGQQGAQISKSESVSFPHTYVHSVELNVARHAATEKQYAATVSQPGVFDQSYSQRPTIAVGNSTVNPAQDGCHSSYINANILTNTLPGQDAGHTSATSISSMNSVGVDQPAVFLPPSSEGSQVPGILLNFGCKLSDGAYIGGGNLPQPPAHPASSQSPIIPEQLLAQLMENKDLLTKLYASQNNVLDGISCAPNTMSNVRPLESSHFTQVQNPVNSNLLPQTYAAFTPNTIMKGLSTAHDSMAPIPHVSTRAFQSNEAAEKQYDPISDSLDPKLPNNMDTQLLSNEAGLDSSAHGTSTLSGPVIQPASTPTAAGAGSSENRVNDQSHDLDQVPAPVGRVDENGNEIERKDEMADHGPVDEMDTDGGADDGKKNKEGKGLRAFKFALAEFVKELLKPTWKEGHVSKEVYKTIVKKVVDKVLDTVQATHIPQTKEKIDHYLSFSKPKLNKLVQAYVEKYQKS